MPRRARSRLTARLLLAAVSVVLALGAAELAFRVYYRIAGLATYVTYGAESEDWKQQWIERHRERGLDVLYGYDQYHPLFGWTLKPNLDGYRFDYHPPVTTNAQGWRAKRDYAYQKLQGITRIVVVGDSLTFGEEVADDDVWPVQLELQLDRTEVLNLAIHGSGTDQQLLIMQEEGIKYAPDVVVVGFFVEDILRNGLWFRDFAKPRFILEGDELVLTNTPVPTPEEVLGQDEGKKPWSYLFHHLHSRLSGRFASRTLDEVVDEDDLMRLTRAIMQRMQEVTTTAGAKLLVVVIPSLHHPMPRVEAILQDWANEIGYAVVNLRQPFDAAEKQYGRTMYKAHHHSPLGNLVAATTVRNALVELGWVAPPSAEALGRLERRLAHVLATAEDGAVDYFNLGKRLADRGQLNEAIELYRKSLAIRSDSPEVHYFLARALHRKGKLDEAAKSYRDALRLRADVPEVHYYLAGILHEQGQLDEGIRLYREALRLRPEFAEVHDSLGRALQQQGQLDAAADSFREALRLRPHAPEVHCLLGRVLHQQGRLDEAIASYQEAIRLRPDYADARDALGQALRQRGSGD